MPVVDREKEREIVIEGKQQGKSDEFIKQAVLRFRERSKGGVPEEIVEEKKPSPLGRGIKAIAGFGIGVGKGALSTLQNIGQATLALPAIFQKGKKFGERLEEVKEETGIPKEILEPKTKAEKAGVVAEEVAEFIAPAGRIIKAGKAAQTLVKSISEGSTIAKGAGLAARSLLEGAGFGTIGSAQKGELDIPTAVLSSLFAPTGAVLKPTARVLSNFLFGPKGTSGFKTRFRNPEEVGEFLKSAKREVGGKNVEDVVTLLNSAIKNVATKAGQTFGKAEEKIIKAKIASSRVVNESKDLAIEALNISKLTLKKIDDAVLESIEKSQMKNLLKLLEKQKDFTTEGVLNLKRQISKLFKGTQRSKSGDRVVTKINNHLNKLIEEADPTFRTATKEFAETKTFLEKLGVNIVGRSKLNVEQTANKLFQLAKDLDNPFKREATEKLLVELQRRSGVPFLKSLEALSTAENLIPQGGQGLRAGVIRELIRLLQLGVSKGAEVAGRVAPTVEKIPKGIGRVGAIETLREVAE